eukprot:765760-Hanusia_phi.AAC.2
MPGPGGPIRPIHAQVTVPGHCNHGPLEGTITHSNGSDDARPGTEFKVRRIARPRVRRETVRASDWARHLAWKEYRTVVT